MGNMGRDLAAMLNMLNGEWNASGILDHGNGYRIGKRLASELKDGDTAKANLLLNQRLFCVDSCSSSLTLDKMWQEIEKFETNLSTSYFCYSEAQSSHMELIC